MRWFKSKLEIDQSFKVAAVIGLILFAISAFYHYQGFSYKPPIWKIPIAVASAIAGIFAIFSGVGLLAVLGGIAALAGGSMELVDALTDPGNTKEYHMAGSFYTLIAFCVLIPALIRARIKKKRILKSSDNKPALRL